VGLDRQIGTNFAISVTGTYKRGRDIIENIDISRPFSAYDPLTNPLDGQPMTIFALNPSFQGVQRVRLLTNPNDPVPLERSDRWQFQGALTLSRSRGNISETQGWPDRTSSRSRGRAEAG
jgi:hypothetical protein